MNESQINQKRLKKWNIHQLDPNRYEPLMTIQDNKETFHFLINEQAEVIKELVIQVQEADERVFMLIQGQFNLKQIKKLIDSIDKNELKGINIKM